MSLTYCIGYLSDDEHLIKRHTHTISKKEAIMKGIVGGK